MKDNEIVHKIKGQAYAVCKICRWNKGKSTHTTGSHDDYDHNPNDFKPSSALKAEIERIEIMMMEEQGL